MNIELVTVSELEQVKFDIILQVKRLLKDKPEKKLWIKSPEVQHLLGCSRGKLQMLRKNSILEYTKIGGTIYYSSDSVNAAFETIKCVRV